MASITLEIPEEFLIDALSHLPNEKRIEILRKSEGYTPVDIHCAKSDTLDRLNGLLSIGGDAVKDTDQLYD